MGVRPPKKLATMLLYLAVESTVHAAFCDYRFSDQKGYDTDLFPYIDPPFLPLTYLVVNDVQWESDKFT